MSKDNIEFNVDIMFFFWERVFHSNVKKEGHIVIPKWRLLISTEYET